MRKDMDKLLCERERRGMRYKYPRKTKYNKDIEDLPNKQGMSGKLRFGWDAKELNENLNPLENFLKKNVGQVWNSVYSEIRERITTSSAVQMHIMEHLDHMVKRHVRIADDGKTIVIPGDYKTWSKHNTHTVDGKSGWYPLSYGYYVCPLSGILKSIKPPKRSRTKKRNWGIELPVFKNGMSIYQIDGIWYEILLSLLPDDWKWNEPHHRTSVNELGETQRQMNFGPVDKYMGPIGGKIHRNKYTGEWHEKSSLKDLIKMYGSTDVYCPDVTNYKRQLSKNELKDLNLMNEIK